MLKWLVPTLVLSCFPHLNAIVVQELRPATPAPVFEIVDLGEAGETSELLHKFALPYTLAPSINNSRQITLNRNGEGIVKDLKYGEWAPHRGEIPGRVFAINNNGDVLAAIGKRPKNTNWFVFEQKMLRQKKEYAINTLDVPGADVYLRALNDQKIAVGSLDPSGALRPAIWTPQKGFRNFGSYLGWDIVAVLWDINEKGTVIGTLKNDQDNPPFIWNAKTGLTTLKNYQHDFEVQARFNVKEGSIHFADNVLSEDNLVYGTLWVDDPSLNSNGKVYFLYQWDPKGSVFKLLGVKGLRVNAVNASGVLAGSWNGKAALREKASEPQELAALTPSISSSWELLEATDINDQGDIVGYGNFQGKLHLFLLVKKK